MKEENVTVKESKVVDEKRKNRRRLKVYIMFIIAILIVCSLTIVLNNLKIDETNKKWREYSRTASALEDLIPEANEDGGIDVSQYSPEEIRNFKDIYRQKTELMDKALDLGEVEDRLELMN